MALSGQLLSGSTNGRGIKVAQTATPGTTVHAADATATDYVTVYAFNSHTAPVKLSLEWGGTTDPDDLIEVTLPIEELTLVAPKLPLTSSLSVAAFAGTADVVVLFGSVDRVT